MLTVISPAKRLDFGDWSGPATQPRFTREANLLAGHARQLSLSALKGLMGLSDDLARLNRDRFRAFAPASDRDNAKPAALAFAGDTYAGLDAASLDADALDWAQERLRILSGLYGLLRPRDLIQPYRLEMGSRLKTRRGGSLYAFWGDTLARTLTEEVRGQGGDTLLNCASQEYFAAADRPALDLRVITPVFLEDRPGGAKVISFQAKRARGAMARYVIDNRLTGPEAILEFDRGGYEYAPDLSEPGRPAFLRRASDRAVA